MTLSLMPLIMGYGIFHTTKVLTAFRFKEGPKTPHYEEVRAKLTSKDMRREWAYDVALLLDHLKHKESEPAMRNAKLKRLLDVLV